MYAAAGQCLVPWTNISSNISFMHRVGPQLVYQCLPGLQPHGEMVSVCTSNGTWYPNPADIVCTHEGIVMSLFSCCDKSLLLCCPNSTIMLLILILDKDHHDHTEFVPTDNNYRDNHGIG